MKNIFHNILKVFFLLLGVVILVFCITNEIDGVGRFACILTGVIFSLVGGLMTYKNKTKED